MQPDSTPSQAPDAAPARITREDLRQRLLQEHPSWLASIQPLYEGDWQQLLDDMERRLPENDPLVQVFVGLALMHAGRRRGFEAFRQALRSPDPRARVLALDQFRYFHAGHIAQDGRPGTLPFGIGELVDAVAPALQEAEADSVQWAVQWLVREAFVPAKRVLAGLRRHRHAEVRRLVLRAYMEHDVDEGTLEMIGNMLLEPGFRPTRELDPGLPPSLCRILADWTADFRKEQHRTRAHALALRVLQEAIAAKDALARLRGLDGWVDPVALLDAVATRKSGEVVAVLHEVAAFRGVEARVRAEALLRHRRMTGLVLPVRELVVDELIAGPRSGVVGELLRDLDAEGLVTLEQLLRAAANPHWCYAATQALLQRTRSPAEDEAAVTGLRAGLREMAPGFALQREHVRYLVETLLALPRTPADDAEIVDSLQLALAAARRVPSEPWLEQEAMGHLLALNATEGMELDRMRPWDAMAVHWQREGISWDEAARLLVAAQAIDAPTPELLAEVAAPGTTGMRERLLRLLGERALFFSLDDIGFEYHHDQLFAQLAALPRPPIVLEDVAQTGEVKLTRVEGVMPDGVAEAMPKVGVFSTEGTLQQVRVRYQGQAFRFAAAPQGTHMDTWAVLHAFDAFLRHIGRSERVFWLAYDQGDSWGDFVTAEPQAFAAACRRLRLPLRERPR